MTILLEKTFEARGSAKAIFNIQTPELLLSGPAGTGKSRSCMEKLNLAALLNPGMRGLIVRKTATSITRSVTPEWKSAVLGDLFGSVVTYYSGSTAEPSQYRYSNGSTIQMMGMDNAQRILSAQFDMVYVQQAEELTLNDWEMIGTRLRNGVMPYQQLLADCNPDSDTHWLKRRVDEGKTLMLRAIHEENPRYFDDDGNITPQGTAYMHWLDNLTGVRYMRLRKGEWVGAEGQIYDEWSSSTHLIDELPEGSESWERMWSVDFGLHNPFVCQMWAIDPDGRMYLYREFYGQGKTVDVWAKEILNVVAPGGKWTERKPRLIVTDHELNTRKIFEKTLGMGTKAADKNVDEGIQRVQARLRRSSLDGKPKLFICKGALIRRDRVLTDRGVPSCTADEIPGYVWDKDKEVPKKENDHGCDAMRYAVMERDKRGSGTPMRWG
jgi:PBSX family phage terminase large subunit